MSHDKFFELLEKVPRIKNIWAGGSFNEEVYRQELGVMSSGEIHIAQFFASVWLGDKFEFDLQDAASAIDENHTELIINWMRAPFWP